MSADVIEAQEMKVILVQQSLWKYFYMRIFGDQSQVLLRIPTFHGLRKSSLSHTFSILKNMDVFVLEEKTPQYGEFL